MNDNLARLMPQDAAQSPIAHALALQLAQSEGASLSALAPPMVDIIERMLAFAALAEQRIAEQARRIEELKSLSITDDLTGLYNRRGFSEMLARALAAGRRYGEPALVGLLDLDGFKAINDTAGHGAGDGVLKAVGELLRRNTRATDCVARLGGDEFAILLTRTMLEPGTRHLFALRDQVGDMRILHEARELRVTASLGVAAAGARATVAEILDRADRAMYADKARRRHPR